MDSAVELYFFRGGYLGFSKLPGGMVNAAALVSREAVSQTGQDRSWYHGRSALSKTGSSSTNCKRPLLCLVHRQLYHPFI